jgi:hypothetical protein
MTTLAADTNGLPIYNANGQPLYQDANGVIMDATGQVATINPTTELPTDTAGNDIPQPPTMVRINALVAHTATTAVTSAIFTASVSKASASAGVIFARAPGRINRDLIDYFTKHGDAVYNRASWLPRVSACGLMTYKLLEAGLPLPSGIPALPLRFRVEICI